MIFPPEPSKECVKVSHANSGIQRISRYSSVE